MYILALSWRQGIFLDVLTHKHRRRPKARLPLASSPRRLPSLASWPSSHSFASPQIAKPHKAIYRPCRASTKRRRATHCELPDYLQACYFLSSLVFFVRGLRSFACWSASAVNSFTFAVSSWNLTINTSGPSSTGFSASNSCCACSATLR